ncbi:MAG: hypothetical protein GY849_08375, partial [Deltaproteobacteria bacterium]|nr:hypothetical protein [Deltaproteobacteria bacterium]
PEISIGLEDAAVEETGTDPVLPEQDSTREILFDMDLPASEGPQIEDIPVTVPSGADDDASLIDPETLSMEDDVSEDGEAPQDLEVMVAAIEEEFKDLDTPGERPAEESTAPDDGAPILDGEALALDRELLGLDLGLESFEEDAQINGAPPGQTPEDKIAFGGLDEPLDLGELESSLEEEKPAIPAEDISPDDSMALDPMALGLDLEEEEPEEKPT